MKTLFSVVIACMFFFTSCGSKETPGTGNTVPGNLTLNATVNPDNSGNVSFVAAATNTVLYTFDFGNGVTQISTTGSLVYKYFASGVYTVTVVAKSASGQTASKTMLVTVSVTASLVWADEFDIAGQPDASKWGYDLGAGGGWGNNEVQYYTNRVDNVTISGGTLKIILKKEAYSGSAYTSARMLSKGKFSFKYGKVEVMAKIPPGGGTWPAIWMLGDNIGTAGWPACGEIDIMEHVGNQLNKIFATLHHPGHSGSNGDGSSVMIPTSTTAFHKYSLDWSASTIKISVDDVPFYTFTNTASLPFNQNFFMILNVAMGGNFGGTVDPAITSAVMEIDYVRVYQ